MKKKLSKKKWIKEAISILLKPPYQYTKKQAVGYANALTESFFDGDYMSPEESIYEDLSCV